MARAVKAQNPDDRRPSTAERIISAVHSGRGLAVAAKAACGAKALGFGDAQLRGLVDHLATEIEARSALRQALQAHLQQRGAAERLAEVTADG